MITVTESCHRFFPLVVVSLSHEQVAATIVEHSPVVALELTGDLVFTPATVTQDELYSAIDGSAQLHIALDGLEIAAKPHAVTHLYGLGNNLWP